MSTAGKIAEPSVQSDWRRWFREGTPPEWTSLALLVVVVAGLAGSYLLTVRALNGRANADAQRDAERVAGALAAVFGAWGDADATPLTQALAGLSGIQAVNWTDSAGVARLSWRRGAVTTTSADGALPAAPVAMRLDRVTQCEAIAPDGTSRGIVQVERGDAAAGGWHTTLLGPWCALTVVLLVSIGIYLRALRRALRPLIAIEKILRQCESSADAAPAAVQLGESLGPVACGWNRVSARLSEVLKRSAAPGDADGLRAALQRLESTRFRQLMDRLPYGVLVVGEGQKIEYANASAGALLGRDAAALSGAALGDAIKDAALEQAVLAARARPGSTQIIDRTADEKAGGAALRFSVQAMPAQAAVGGLLVTIEDVTMLRESQRARDNFLYHVTHELRTPLTNIHAYTETLAAPGFEDPRARKECYNVLISETERLSRLVEDVLSLSQLEVGSARLDVSDVDLLKLVRQTVQDNLGHADAKRIDLNLAVPPKAPKIRGDKQRLSVLLQNLVGNAIKYTPEGGRVQVVVEAQDGGDAGLVRIAVKDTGFGIAPEDQAHVFEKFYRANDERVQSVKGTGLGLALAQEVARLHGGEIRLESELGKGSTFTVELPCGSAAALEVTAR